MAKGLIGGTDDDAMDDEYDGGRIGRGFSDIANENTASLGLKKSITKVSQSLGRMLNEDRTRDWDSEQIAFQFLAAKVYENREYIAKAGVSASLAKKQSESFFGFHDQISIAPTDFYPRGDAEGEYLLVSNNGDRIVGTAGTYVANVTVPLGRTASTITVYATKSGRGDQSTFLAFQNSFVNTSSTVLMSKVGEMSNTVTLNTNFEASKSNYLSIAVTLVRGHEIYGAKIGIS